MVCLVVLIGLVEVTKVWYNFYVFVQFPFLRSISCDYAAVKHNVSELNLI